MGVPKIPNLRLEEPKEKGLTNIAVTNKEKLSKMNDKLQKGQVELNNEKPNEHLKNQAGDLMGVTTNSTIDPQMQSVMFNIPNSVSKVLGIRDKDINDSKEIPSLELSLKTQTDSLDTGFSLKTQSDALDTGFSVHDRNAPRHLDLSSLSRYAATQKLYHCHSKRYLNPICDPKYELFWCFAGTIFVQLLIRPGLRVLLGILLYMIAQRKKRQNHCLFFSVIQTALPFIIPMTSVTTMAWTPLQLISLPNKRHLRPNQIRNEQSNISNLPLPSNQTVISFYLYLTL